METLDDYLARKNRELAYLAAQVRPDLAAPVAAGMLEVPRLKQALRAAQLARSIATHPDLLETNVRPGRERRFEGFRLAYYYQRFDMGVSGPPIHATLCGDEAPALIRMERYFSSGMGAISAALLALDAVAAGPRRVLIQRDAYFETLQLLRAWPRRLQVEALASLADLRAVLATAPGGVALYLDSIAAEDPITLLADLPAPGPDLLLLDSTCYDREDPRLLAVARVAERLALPVLLLRSHQKLDHLGIEHGRLGSLVALLPPQAAPARHRLLRELLAQTDTLRRLLGSAAVPHLLLPYAADPAFQALNAQRLALMAARNARAAAFLAGRLPPGAVRGYHHGRFVTIASEVLGSLSQAHLEQAVEDLAATAAQEGLPARRAASFGFDFASLTVFPDLATGRACLRVAFADHPWPVCEALCGLILTWHGGLGG
ncbi:MAG: hypothetical protein ABIO70_18310 [Pseudomonadota bacterium]